MGLASIPESLWMDEHIIMSSLLTGPLQAELVGRGQFEIACGPNVKEKDLIGGHSPEAALKHFGARFATSSARVQFVTLNAGKYFKQTSIDLLSLFLDGRIAILDQGSGTALKAKRTGTSTRRSGAE